METGGYEERKWKLLATAQDQTAKQLRSDLAKQSTKVLDLEAQLTRARNGRIRPMEPAELEQIDSLNAALADFQRRFDEMQQSLSWRITAPLRALAKPFVKS